MIKAAFMWPRQFGGRGNKVICKDINPTAIVSIGQNEGPPSWDGPSIVSLRGQLRRSVPSFWRLLSDLPRAAHDNETFDHLLSVVDDKLDVVRLPLRSSVGGSISANDHVGMRLSIAPVTAASCKLWNADALWYPKRIDMMTENTLKSITALGAIAALIGLDGCDGPNETAGREQDRAAELANNGAQVGEGVNEARGEAIDRSQQAAREVREARADALEKQGDQMRVNADIGADRLDQQAERVRNGEAK